MLPFLKGAVREGLIFTIVLGSIPKQLASMVEALTCKLWVPKNYMFTIAE